MADPKTMTREKLDTIDEHLKSMGIEVSYTNVFWGGRSEIKPSEIAPAAYVEWCRGNGIDPEGMWE